ncbi:MAG: hypothetical protein OXC08_06510 [Thiotrichales bacterium]|nr:hypothetical protein [Thiotrichales bacterium]
MAVLLWNGIHLQERISELEATARHNQATITDLYTPLSELEAGSRTLSSQIQEGLSRVEAIIVSIETRMTELEELIHHVPKTSEENAPGDNSSRNKDNTTTSKLEMILKVLFEYPNIYTKEEFYERKVKHIGINPSYYNTLMDVLIKEGFVETDETGKIMFILSGADN